MRTTLWIAAALGLAGCCARPCRPTDESPRPPAARAVATATVAVEAVAAPPAADPDLDRLVAWMTGTFRSEAQAKADPEYRDIRLVMVPIWQDRADGPWLYVEQAMAALPQRPYRQRVYEVVHAGGDLFESRVYQLKDAAAAVAAWKDRVPLASVRREDLKALTGCTVVLRKADEATFRGATLGSACQNAFGGARYATSEVTITAEGLVSWDRGYDAKHEQVWGATKGGYEFRKVSPQPPPAPAAAPTPLGAPKPTGN